ncbi:hypothetical protein QCA50_006040 [Cerrena zonata]|uniref:Uncharacterized protein n=1 Tax=Cerrena zonata TaxID=2478898 RepID=A0AAW0GEL6_9APHY
MNFSYAPDFVIKKKRKRSKQPVDPCLGYYLSSPSIAAYPSPRPIPHEALGLLPEENTINLDLPHEPIPLVLVTPGEQAVARTTNVQPECQITVEDFLKWSAKTPSRTYKKRKRKLKVVDICAPYNTSIHDLSSSDRNGSSEDELRPTKRHNIRRINSEDTEGSAYTPSVHPSACEEASSPSPKKRKRYRKAKKVKPSMDRLRAAALRSHVNLPDNPNDARMPGLRPLDLEPMSPCLACSPEHKKWRYVDPRKTPRYPDVLSATSYPRNCPDSPSARKEFKCISYWTPQIVPTISDRATPELSKSRTAKKRGRTHIEPPSYDTRSSMAPLAFVSLEEHEKLLIERNPNAETFRTNPGAVTEILPSFMIPRRTPDGRRNLFDQSNITSNTPELFVTSLSHVRDPFNTLLSPFSDQSQETARIQLENLLRSNADNSSIYD